MAEILRSDSQSATAQLVTATDVAAQFGVSRTWVYDNAERLEAVRLGPGSKARLRFDPDRVRELIQGGARRRATRKSPSGQRWLNDADLIPIRGR